MFISVFGLLTKAVGVREWQIRKRKQQHYSPRHAHYKGVCTFRPHCLGGSIMVLLASIYQTNLGGSLDMWQTSLGVSSLLEQAHKSFINNSPGK